MILPHTSRVISSVNREVDVVDKRLGLATGIWSAQIGCDSVLEGSSCGPRSRLYAIGRTKTSVEQWWPRIEDGQIHEDMTPSFLSPLLSVTMHQAASRGPLDPRAGLGPGLAPKPGGSNRKLSVESRFTIRQYEQVPDHLSMAMFTPDRGMLYVSRTEGSPSLSVVGYLWGPVNRVSEIRGSFVAGVFRQSKNARSPRIDRSLLRHLERIADEVTSRSRQLWAAQ